MWLVKWDGFVALLLSSYPSLRLTNTVGSTMHRYKADQATWAANEHLGECAKFIEDFQEAAEIEGRDLSARDKNILLNEAAAAGWV